MTTEVDKRDPIATLHRPSATDARARGESLRNRQAHLRQEALERLLVAEEYAVLASGKRQTQRDHATRKELTSLVKQQVEIVDSELVLLQEALEAAVDVYGEEDFLQGLLDHVIDAQQSLWALRMALRDIKRE